MPSPQTGIKCLRPVRDINAALRGRTTLRQKGPLTEELRFVSVEVCRPITSLVAQGPFNRKTSQQMEKIAMGNVNKH